MTQTPADQPAAANAASSDAFTEDEHATLRSAALLASAMVSRAEKGMFDSIKESFAASKAIAGSPPQVAALVGKGGFPELPKGTPEQVEARTIELLGEAVTILRAKAPELVDGYRAMVLESCRDAAAAADDTSGNELAAIAKVESALA
jgi:hypothetical protein